MGKIRPELVLWDAERAHVRVHELGASSQTDKQSAHNRGGIAHARQRLKRYRRPDCRVLQRSSSASDRASQVGRVPGLSGAAAAWALRADTRRRALARGNCIAANAWADARRCAMT